MDVTMPKPTRIAFIMGYVDIGCRFVSWMVGSGGLLYELLFLGILIAATMGKRWARVAWSIWLGVGIIISGKLLFTMYILNEPGWKILSLLLLGIFLPVLVLRLLWHPETTVWFDRKNRPSA